MIVRRFAVPAVVAFFLHAAAFALLPLVENPYVSHGRKPLVVRVMKSPGRIEKPRLSRAPVLPVRGERKVKVKEAARVESSRPLPAGEMKGEKREVSREEISPPSNPRGKWETQEEERKAEVADEAVSPMKGFHWGEGAKGASSGYVPPRLASMPEPKYPFFARRRGIEGTVVLLLEVDEGGRVRDVRILASSGHPLLDEEAISAARKARFTPAQLGWSPVPSEKKLAVRFRLE